MFFIDLLRAAAILLITNSHLDGFYPWPLLASGGMFGNELFFFISGYGLTLSLGRKRERFGPWIARRFRRIYEPLFYATTFLVLIGFYPLSSLYDVLYLYSGFWKYWFLPVIFCFYVPFYFVVSHRRAAALSSVAVIVASIGYVVAYVTLVDRTRFDVESHVLSKAPFYFVVMLLGATAARRAREISPRWLDFALLILASGAYLADQFAMRASGQFELQFTIHLIGIVWIIAVYRCAHHHQLLKIESRLLGRAIIFLSSIALQIYLLQELFIKSSFIEAVPFPADIFVFWLAVLPAAWLFKKINVGGASKFFSRRETGARKT